MVRCYKRKPGAKRYQDYQITNLNQAVSSEGKTCLVCEKPQKSTKCVKVQLIVNF